MKRWLVFGLALLTGCAAPPAPDSLALARWDQHRASLQDWNAWQLRGRVAVSAGDDGWHARLVWNQSPQQFDLKLQGPLGQGTVFLAGDERQVALSHGDQRRVARDPEQLLEQELGWRLPLKGLTDWVRGLPHQAGSDHQYDSDGRLLSLRELGWDIAFDRYGTVEGVDLPTRLRLENDQVRVKLIVDQWQRQGSDGS